MNLLTVFRQAVCNRAGVSQLLRLFGACLLSTPALRAAGNPVHAGSNVTLVASADGSPAPTFQWKKNGVPIPGATGPTLSFNGIGLADAGTYQVLATNVVGSSSSPDEILTVDTEVVTATPAFVTQPLAFQTAVIGSSVTLSVSASGNPTPALQWQKNGATIAGATNATLTLTSVTTADSATYTAVATNSVGSVTSSAAVLAVVEPSVNPPNVAPTFTSQPSASQTVAAGGSASFSVAAVGLPAPTYQWKKNGTAIAGATNATFALPFVTVSDSGSYVAEATNTAGSATSYPAVLIVSAAVSNPPPPPPLLPTSPTSAPLITSQPASSQTVTAGASASFAAVAAGGPTPAYQWRKNGKNLSGATSGTLSINSVTTADAGVYSVLASNASGVVVSDNSTLVVYTRPVVTVQPLPQAVLIGATAKFTVSVSAVPGATLQWLKNGTPILGATSGLLSLSSVSSADIAGYSVVATNPLGTVTSNTANLIIAVPPVITTQPVSQTVSANTNVELIAAASGSPAPSFQWKKNGVSISGATQATLSLKDVTKNESGLYSVEVTNVAGWVTSNVATLVVNAAAGKNSTDSSSTVGTNPSGPTVPGVETPVAAGLVNLSVRATAGAGNNALIVGFVINGSSTKPLLIRGIGPTLRDFGVAGALLDPKLSLYSGTSITAVNDDWGTNENAVQIVGTSTRVGAFSLADRTSDSALMATLETGAYTVQLTGKDSASGVGLVEVYDAATAGSAKLVNLSVRAYIGNGNDVPNVGFVIAGTTSKRVLIRAVGPTLSTFAVSDAISDPQIELFKGSTRIDLNDNWGGSAAISTLFGQVGAFALSDVGSRDAVLSVALEPGAYTVVVSGANGTTGIGLVELYEAP
jgi:hypothetical protein